VFRYPLDPSVNYIKRLVGLPGDHVEVRHDRITVNGTPVPFKIVGPYNDGCYVNFQLAQEILGTHTHEAMLCPVPLDPSPNPLPGCNRKEARGYNCGDGEGAASLLNDEPVWSHVVPPGEYLMMGDNRDNSEDGRVWGFVPEANLVGKATRIWFNWDPQRSGGPTWSRIGSAIK
jgi:signal peptidase I